MAPANGHHTNHLAYFIYWIRKLVRELLNKAAWDRHDWILSVDKWPWQTILARSPKWLSFLLVILIAQAAAEMTWLVLSPEENNKQTAVRGPITAMPSSQVRLNSVVNLHLFGEASQIETVVTDAPIDAPKTNLKLVLRGVFSNSDQDKAMAIIADAAGKESLYRTGSQVPGGATVHTIYGDRVILQRNGQFETLYLPRDEIPGQAVAMSQVSRPSPSVQKERSVQAPDKLKEMRNMIKTNPQEIWKQVRVEPVLEDGRIKGYRLFHQDAQLMRAFGISKSDVITEVNGMSLDDPAALYELMGQFDTASDIRLTVERNGGTEVLVVHM